MQATFTPEEKQFLLDLARKTITEAVAHNALPKFDPHGLSNGLTESKGCFVTLTAGGRLRGCIGNIMPAGPLYKSVMENARNAALRDPRFTPVRAEEIDEIHVEISVLTAPQPLAFSSPDDLLAKLQPHKDGVVLQIGFAAATYLPQVWEQLPDKEAFLSSLAQKAGCAANAWRGPNASVSIYHVEAFEEPRK